MKIITLRVLLLTALSVATAASRAQSPSPAASASVTPAVTASRPGDPFVKKQAVDPAAKKPEPQVTLCFTVEVYALAQSDAAQLLTENTSGKVRHERVLDLVRKGKARFEMLIGDMTKSLQRSVVYQIDEFRYPPQFGEPAAANQPAWPNEWETRDVGYILENETAVSSDHTLCETNVVLARTTLHDFRDCSGKKGGTPTGQPIFDSRKITTSLTIPTGSAEFLGTLSDQPQLEETEPAKGLEVRLAFGRVDIKTFAPSVSAQNPQEHATLEHQLSFYSLPREAARDILAGAQKAGDCYTGVQGLVNRKAARLERISVLKTNSGQRAVVEEIQEFRLATEYALRAAAPTAFETRNLGLTLEIEPLLGPGSIVDINLVPQIVRFAGEQQTTGISATYPPQPVFEERKITTSLSAALGEQALIGTFNPPGDTGVNGQKDDGRVWLGFVRTTLAAP